MSLLPSKISKLASRRHKRQRSILRQLTQASLTLFYQHRLFHCHLSGENSLSILVPTRRTLTSFLTSSQISRRQLSLCLLAPFCPMKAMLNSSLPSTRMAILSLAKTPSLSSLEKLSSCLSRSLSTLFSTSVSLTLKIDISSMKRALRLKRKSLLS